MAAIDYNGIKTELKSILDSQTFTYQPEIGIEGDMLTESYVPYINIEIESRNDSPSQSISANTRQRYQMTLLLTVAVKNFDKSQAALVRDSIISELELFIMQNRTINGKVITLWLSGGDNIAAFVENFNSYVSAAGLRITAECLISV